MWYFLEEDGHVKLVSGSTVLRVTKIERHVMEHLIEVYQDDDEDSQIFDLQNFDSTKNRFCEKLRSVTHSRGLFVKAFNHLRGNSANSSCTDETSGADDSIQSRQTVCSSTSLGEKSEDGTTADRAKKLSQSKKTAASKTGDNQKKRTQKKKTGNTRYQSNLKVLGECIDVHLSNLVEPAPERLVRPVNSDHVQFLTEEFRKNSTSFVMLAGLVGEECELTTLAEPDCGIEVETIGGNHSRIALQYLMASGQLVEEKVKVKLYHGLTNDEALEIGVYHNAQAQKSKQMSFMDISRLIRDKLEHCSPDNILGEKKKLAQIFGQKNVTSFNNNFKASLALARKATEKIWCLTLTLERKWRDGEIKGGKKGEEIKQTIIHDLYSRNLKDEDRETLLETLIEKGRPAFTKLLQQLAEKNNKEDNQEQGEEVCVPQNAMVDPEVDNDTTEVQNSAQENEMVDVEDLEEDSETTESREDERNKFIMEIDQLKQENEKLKTENERLKQMVKDLKEKNTEEAADKDAFASHLNLIGKRVLEEAVDNENQIQSKKRKTVMMDDGFSIGEAVKAIWSKDGNLYDARVMKKHDNGKYTVKFYDGIKELRTRQQIQPRF